MSTENKLRSFCANRDGSTLMIFGLMLVPLMGFAGAAVDMARWSYASTETKRAADSAVLAGVGVLRDGGTSAEAKSAAKDYYIMNAKKGVPLKTDAITFEVNAEGTKVTAKGNATIETTLLKLIGIDELPVMNDPSGGFAVAEIVAGTGGKIEISVMLDVTGSMCDDGAGPCSSGSKLDALKQAANTLVDTVVPDDNSDERARISLVPFSTQVRVAQDGEGADIMKKLTNLDATWSGWIEHCEDWSGSGGSEDDGSWICNQKAAKQVTNWKVIPCVTDRFFDGGWTYGHGEAKPGTANWMNGRAGSRMPLAWDSTDIAPSQWTGNSETDPMTSWNYDENGTCWDVNEANELLPLTGSKSILKDRINGLEAYGSTSGPLGTALSWYTLSPQWADVWPAASKPGAYQTNESDEAPRKVAILMSDGVYNTVRGWKGQNQAHMKDHATKVCTDMKDAGIEIYTVGFALDELSGDERALAENTLRECGSDVEHFYNTFDIEQLTAAFKSIAVKISSQTALTR